MMTTAEPAVIISKQSGGKKKDQEKKNQGPTRDEVFGRVDDILVKLIEDGSTNQVSQLSHMPIITVLWSRSNLVPALDKKKIVKQIKLKIGTYLLFWRKKVKSFAFMNVYLPGICSFKLG